VVAGAERRGSEPSVGGQQLARSRYDSARTKLFPEAYFGGSCGRRNSVQTRKSKQRFPSGWNITYLNVGNASSTAGVMATRHRRSAPTWRR